MSITPQWVKLHLVPQTDENREMPSYIIGLLTSETQGSYVLNPVLECVKRLLEPTGMSFINKTYVWRCQILEAKPDVLLDDDLDDDLDDEFSGGLG